MPNIFEEIRKKDMLELIEKALRGDKNSYKEFVDTCEKLHRQFPDAPPDPLLRFVVGKVRQEKWPVGLVAANSLWLDQVIGDEAFKLLRRKGSFEAFCKNANTEEVPTVAEKAPTVS